MSFNDLKKNRKSALEGLTKELSKISEKGGDSSADDRFWTPTVNKDGNGHAIIRFLPAPEGEKVPFIRVWNHGFQGPGGWYIEKSLSTIGQDDPCGEYNNQLWNSGLDSDKEIARKQKRKLSFYSNIYVVKDPGNPTNEGKVFIFKYGKKIFDKLNDLMNPAFDDQDPVNPFDLWEGANFRLRITTVDEYRNYDKSDFDSPSALLDDDDELEAVYKSEYKLQEFLDPSQFKTYDELKARLDKVLGLNSSKKKEVPEEDYTPAPKFKEKVSDEPWKTESDTSTDDDDDDLAFFRKLKEED